MPAPEHRPAMCEVWPECRRRVVCRGLIVGRLGWFVLAWRRMFPRVVLRLRQIDAAADGFLFDGPNREMRRQKSPLDFRVVRETGGQTEELLVDIQVNCRFIVS